MIFGGQFTKAGQTSITALIRTTTSGAIDSKFNLRLEPGILDASVRSIAVQANGRILIGGTWKSVAGVDQPNIARLKRDGTLDTSFRPQLRCTVSAIAIQADGRLLVGGCFSEVNGEDRELVVRLLQNGSLDPDFARYEPPSEDSGGVTGISITREGQIMVAGSFISAEGVVTGLITRLNADGTVDESFSARADDQVWAVESLADGSSLIGGNFETVNGVKIGRLARLNPDGSLDRRFRGRIDGGSVSAIEALPDGRLVVGGTFLRVNGILNPHIARLSAKGVLDKRMNPFGSPTAAMCCVDAVLVEPSGSLVLGGTFTQVGKSKRGRIVRVFG